MSAHPTISIIINCYNYADYVRVAIDSVLNQTRPADEIIVIDDGSTDTSAEVIRSYGAKVKGVFKRNEGKIAAVNEGCALATSDIILNLDADDALYPEALEQVAAYFTPGVVKVQYDLDIIDDKGQLMGRRFCNFTGDVPPEQTAAQFAATGTYAWPVTSGNAYTKAFLDQVMPMTPPVSQDGVLNTIAPLYGKVATIGRSLGQYRIHGKNLSRKTAQGANNPFPDFPRRIAGRAKEFDILREHAAKLGVALPGTELINNELVFVNYKLMAQKLGQAYPGSAGETVKSLLARSLKLVKSGGYSAKARLAHAAWARLLATVPDSLARTLVILRFNRGYIVRNLFKGAKA